MPSIRSWHHQQQPSGTAAPVPLILDSLAANKVNMVENLVGKSVWTIFKGHTVKLIPS
jgi:hypothetical protein